jgi:hypothetical protein
MSRKWGAIFVFIGIVLIFTPWLIPFLESLPYYLRLSFAFIFQYGSILERIFPVSLILLGFAILVGGFLRRTLILLAFAVALISIVAIILPSHGLISTMSMSSISEKEIEFFAGDMIVEWEGGEGKGGGVREVWRKDGSRVVKVKGDSLNIEFFVGSVEVFLPSDKDVSVNIDGGIGDIKVFAPKNVRVEVEGNLGIGSFENNHVAINPEHTARISYDLGIGEVRIE